MKKYLLLIAFSSTLLMATQAQDDKTNKLILHLSNVLIEGYDGEEIIFSSLNSEEPAMDPKAKGLKVINSSGFSNKSKLGIRVITKGSTLIVDEIAPVTAIKIRAPKNVIVFFACHKKLDSGKVICRNLENEIEIESDYNNVSLENITGPVTVRTLYGSVDAIFTAPVKGPVSIVSVHSNIDVAIPVDTKANIKLKSSESAILASPDFKITIEKTDKKDITTYGSFVTGKLNGGGQDLKLASEYGIIYLRKTL